MQIKAHHISIKISLLSVLNHKNMSIAEPVIAFKIKNRRAAIPIFRFNIKFEYIWIMKTVGGFKIQFR